MPCHAQAGRLSHLTVQVVQTTGKWRTGSEVPAISCLGQKQWSSIRSPPTTRGCWLASITLLVMVKRRDQVPPPSPLPPPPPPPGPFLFPSSSGLLHRLEDPVVAWLVGWCLTSEQHARVSQGRIYSDNRTCCSTEIKKNCRSNFLTHPVTV